MMMNIRGLIFDDPQGTADIKLPSLEFIVADDPVDNQTTNTNVHATGELDVWERHSVPETNPACPGKFIDRVLILYFIIIIIIYSCFCECRVS